MKGDLIMTQTRKNFLELLVSAFVCALIIFCSTVVSHAVIYPLLIPDEYEITRSNAYLLTDITYQYTPAYQRERSICTIYSPDGEIVFYKQGVGQTGGTTFMPHFVWYSGGYPEGRYKVVTQMQFFSSGLWITSPNDCVSYINLKNARPKINSIKNMGDGKIKISWGSIYEARKYQIQIGDKKYTAYGTSYTSKALKSGKTYSVKVRAGFEDGYYKWGEAKKIKIIKNNKKKKTAKALAKVTGLKVTKHSPNQVKLTWKKVKNAKKYKVYRNNYRKYKDDIKDWECIKTTTDTSCVVSQSPGIMFDYSIQSVNGSVVGEFSSTDWISLADFDAGSISFSIDEYSSDGAPLTCTITNNAPYTLSFNTSIDFYPCLNGTYRAGKYNMYIIKDAVSTDSLTPMPKKDDGGGNTLYELPSGKGMKFTLWCLDSPIVNYSQNNYFANLTYSIGADFHFIYWTEEGGCRWQSPAEKASYTSDF